MISNSFRAGCIPTIWNPICGADTLLPTATAIGICSGGDVLTLLCLALVLLLPRRFRLSRERDDLSKSTLDSLNLLCFSRSLSLVFSLSCSLSARFSFLPLSFSLSSSASSSFDLAFIFCSRSFSLRSFSFFSFVTFVSSFSFFSLVSFVSFFSFFSFFISFFISFLVFNCSSLSSRPRLCPRSSSSSFTSCLTSTFAVALLELPPAMASLSSSSSSLTSFFTSSSIFMP
mmetsp:Transcript_35121/g.80404  ORF Transcript_35121/g.80404 Transcript_35121/m.80404 type:complete len:230 (-) Transcript_35121:670-1359(-)